MKVLETVKEVLNTYLLVEISEINFDDNIVNDLGADSLDQVEIIIDLEESYDIEVSNEDAEKLKTVRDIVDFIENLIKD